MTEQQLVSEYNKTLVRLQKARTEQKIWIGVQIMVIGLALIGNSLPGAGIGSFFLITMVFALRRYDAWIAETQAVRDSLLQQPKPLGKREPW